jgi:glutathione reductase (NADPH)
MQIETFDMIVLGAGSGGLAAAIRAGRHGARVAILDPGLIGGTCVNVGCVPKKAFWYAAQMSDGFGLARAYGFQEVTDRPLDWPAFVLRRQAYIDRIHAGYQRTLAETHVQMIHDRGELIAADRVSTGTRILSAPHIVIATGARPRRLDTPGFELGMVSDGFFDLRECPPRTAIVGGGYIAVELAGVLRALGSEVTMYVRHRLMGGFDEPMADALAGHMVAHGIHINYGCEVEAVNRDGGQLRLSCDKGGQPEPYDALIWAVGRDPNSSGIGLEAIGVEVDANGHIVVDRYQDTCVPGVHAIGDVTQAKALTPVAVQAGRHLADRLFCGKADAHVDPEYVPSVVFSHPPLATVGLTEVEARRKYGDEVTVYNGSFVPMQFGLAGRSERSLIRMICLGSEERVVGLHMLGVEADEIMQGFAVALRLGACKKDFDTTAAIHPTSSEELVLLNARTA